MGTVSERVYSELPDQPLEVIAAFKLNKKVAPEFSASFLAENIRPYAVSKGEHLLSNKTFILDPFKPPLRLPKFCRSTKQLTRREKRKLKIHDIPNTGFKYSDFTKLHQLWQSYMRECLSFDKPTFDPKSKSVEDILLRADYHGCLVKVEQSKCPSYVGTFGIIIQDTRETYKIINADDQVKVIPKKNTIFAFRLGSYKLRIFGSNFCYRPADRINKKFKALSSIDL